MRKLCKRFFSCLKKVNHRHYICIAFCILMSAWSVFLCKNSWTRLVESIIDFAFSLADLMFYKFDWCPDVTVTSVSSVDVITLIPQSWVDFATHFDIFLKMLFDITNFLNYLLWILPVLQFLSQMMLMLALFALIVFVIKKVVKPVATKNTGEQGRLLISYKKLRERVLVPTKDYIASAIKFFLEIKIYKSLFIACFLFSTNLLTILFEFFAYYFYFCGTFDFINFPIQIYKLSVDLVIAWQSLPALIWFYIGWRVFDYFSRRYAYKRLLVLEALNKAIIKLLGLITLIVAPMRGGKTKLQSSMNVTKAQVVRENMLENMLQVHTHFPHFPFERFIAFLNEKFDELKSLRLCEELIQDLCDNFAEEPIEDNLFGYEFMKYPLSCDNGLVIIGIFDDLCTFTKSYIVYKEPTLFIGNYSIRELHVQITQGNFPLWDYNVFKKPSFDGSGVFARKLDFDIVRPGKKLGEDKDIYGLLEYGLLCIQEADKEFGNKTETEEMKRSSSKANMKNDLHNKFFKTMGHAGMINYKATLSATMDSQRKSSLGADTTELGLVCHIKEESSTLLTLPFFLYRDMLYRLFKSWHKKFKSFDWHWRADCTLHGYFIDSFLSRYICYCERIYNTFGYTELELAICDPSGEGEKQEITWYAINKKDKGGLYATDGLREMFRRHNKNSGKGLRSLNQYNSLHPSLDELKEDLNSFMINDFTRENKDET